MDFDEIDRPSDAHAKNQGVISGDPLRNRTPTGAMDHDGHPYDEVDLPSPVKKQSEPPTPVDVVDTPFDANRRPSVRQDEREQNDDSTDSPDPSTPGTKSNPEQQGTSQTDGPFGSLFGSKHDKKVINKSSSTYKGVTTTHVTLYPQKPDSTGEGKPPSDLYYKMDTFPRGKFVLINEEKFLPGSVNYGSPRDGTNRDADALQELFLELGYIVERHDNVTVGDIISIFKVAANEDYKGMSCFASAILSHGDEGVIYGTDTEFQMSKLTEIMRNAPGLVGKPKFIIVQACQGQKYMESMDMVDGPAAQSSWASEKYEQKQMTLPSDADFLYAYSTVPGFFAWRNSKHGSWFVQKLVEVFRQQAHKLDVLRLLTRVNHSVAGRKSNTGDYITHNKRQIASIVTQLRKELYLMPFQPLERM